MIADRPIRVRALLLTASCVLPGVLGCGGGDDADSAAPPQPVQRRPAAAPVAAAVDPAPAPADPDDGDSGKADSDDPKPAALPANAHPEDVFVVGGESNSEFILLPRERESTEDAFVLADVPDGAMVDLGPPPPRGGSLRNGLRFPAGFTVLTEYGFDARGFPMRIVSERDKSVMLLVPAGHFAMGTDDGDENARPEISVHLDPYYIDRQEITVEQYVAFRESLKATEKGRVKLPVNAEGDPNEPAHGLRFTDANAYAQWSGRDLPTEAEWEKAARGTDGEFPWGHGRPLFSFGRSTEDIDLVRTFPQDRSPYGVWDMGGNVREWCRDWYADDAYAKALERGTSLENWEGPSSADREFRRVVKGNGPGWHAWYREGRPGTKPGEGVGFRCVLRYRGPSDPTEAAPGAVPNQN